MINNLWGFIYPEMYAQAWRWAYLLKLFVFERDVANFHSTINRKTVIDFKWIKIIHRKNWLQKYDRFPKILERKSSYSNFWKKRTVTFTYVTLSLRTVKNLCSNLQKPPLSSENLTNTSGPQYRKNNQWPFFWIWKINRG